jgi:hypothetical protein
MTIGTMKKMMILWPLPVLGMTKRSTLAYLVRRRAISHQAIKVGILLAAVRCTIA